MKKFQPLKGHENCKASSGIHCLTFGTGKLDTHGFWEHGCQECAREHERQFPKDGPHTEQQIKEVFGW